MGLLYSCFSDFTSLPFPTCISFYLVGLTFGCLRYSKQPLSSFFVNVKYQLEYKSRLLLVVAMVVVVVVADVCFIATDVVVVVPC